MWIYTYPVTHTPLSTGTTLPLLLAAAEPTEHLDISRRLTRENVIITSWRHYNFNAWNLKWRVEIAFIRVYS
jgi:hypothetical protein